MSAPTNYVSLAGKVAIVTGGNSGIGASTVKRLAAAGANVMINYRSASSADEANALATSIGPNASTVQADASTIEGIETIVSTTVSKWGHIDIAIANAAVMLVKDLASTTPEDFSRSFATNVQGPYFLAQKVVPHMPVGGRIIFMSTSLVKNSSLAPHYLLYNSTKGAIEQMTRIIARDLGTKGITVNAVAPGPTGTDLFFKGKSEQVLDMIRKQSPQNRIGTPEEIADVIAFVAGPESRWISGQTIMANGASIV